MNMSPFFKKRTKKNKVPTIPESKILENSTKIISPKLEDNIYEINKIFQKNMDFLIRKFNLFGKTPAVLICLKSLVSTEKIDRDIIKLLQEGEPLSDPSQQVTQYIINNILYFSDVKEVSELSSFIKAISSGKALILIEGEEYGIELDVVEKEKRSIEEPATERVVRGPRDGFIEQIMTNISLLRYRLPVPEFQIEETEVGKRTRTKVAICYMDDIVSEVIQDRPNSPFPQVQNTERPDKVIGNILEGRVAILIDGSPFALIVPATFNQFYQTSEDYYERWIISSFVRIVRMAALIFSLTFSSFYITVLSFHPELIPANFVVAAASGRQGVPFPVIFEVLVMEFAMEILREATVRMPQQVGGALSIVGVLVVGQAAVQAGFVSPITVVIIALSTIGSFATPSYNAATAFRMLRFLLIILAGTFGLLGLAVGIMLVLNHMLSIRSFGIPYMTPFSPGNIKSLKDSIFRAPFYWLKERPAENHVRDAQRIGKKVKDTTKNNFLDNNGGDFDET
ncbi:spore germination protein [Lysinibacillus telephonicus]|uniref:spore germination protein n=1 Tax=Lysinibacillus telephonicus TaxID=1714840 RepID=UPI003BA1628C